jgi:hypothetical protein
MNDSLNMCTKCWIFHKNFKCILEFKMWWQLEVLYLWLLQRKGEDKRNCSFHRNLEWNLGNWALVTGVMRTHFCRCNYSVDVVLKILNYVGCFTFLIGEAYYICVTTNVQLWKHISQNQRWCDDGQLFWSRMFWWIKWWMWCRTW